MLLPVSVIDPLVNTLKHPRERPLRPAPPGLSSSATSPVVGDAPEGGKKKRMRVADGGGAGDVAHLAAHQPPGFKPMSGASLTSSDSTSPSVKFSPPQTPPSNISAAFQNALPDPIQLLPQRLRRPYEKYFWAFYLGPHRTMFPIEREVIIAASVATFSREGIFEQKDGERDRTTPGEPSDAGRNPAVTSPSSCILAAQEGLTWAVLALGAQMCQQPREAFRFVVQSRLSLQQSVSCANEVTVLTLALLECFYHGIRDFRVSLLFNKMKLDVFNSIPSSSRSESLRAICDFTCLWMHIPPSPTSQAPLQLLEQDHREFEALLSDNSSTATPLPTIQRAGYAALRLLGEAIGTLLYVERTEGRGPLNDLLSIADRDLELCQRIHAFWRPFGAMNELMGAFYSTVRVWLMYLIVEMSQKDQPAAKGSRGGLASGGGGREGGEGPFRPKYEISWAMMQNQPVADYLKEQTQAYDEERKVLEEVMPVITQNIVSRFSSRAESFASVENMTNLSHDDRLWVRPTPSKMLGMPNPQLREQATAIARSAVATLKQYRSWVKYFPVNIGHVYSNLASVLVDWDLWAELEELHECFKVSAEVWPVALCHMVRITRALQKKAESDGTPGKEGPRISMIRISGLPVLLGKRPEEMTSQIVPEQPPSASQPAQSPFEISDEVVQFDFSSFWDTTPGYLDLRNFLGEVDLSTFSVEEPLPF